MPMWVHRPALGNLGSSTGLSRWPAHTCNRWYFRVHLHLLPKPANSGNTRPRKRKRVKPSRKTHADSANCETAANAPGLRLAEKQRREPTQHTPQKTANGRRNSTSTTTAANEPCPASYPAPTA